MTGVCSSRAPEQEYWHSLEFAKLLRRLRPDLERLADFHKATVIPSRCGAVQTPQRHSLIA